MKTIWSCGGKMGKISIFRSSCTLITFYLWLNFLPNTQSFCPGHIGSWGCLVVGGTTPQQPCARIRMAGKGFGEPNPKKPASKEEPSFKKPKPALGTLFKKDKEEIRELDSDEYLEALQEWVPLAKFAAEEVADPSVDQSQAKDSFNVLKKMVRWQPPNKQTDFTKEGSGWAFGCAVGAFLDEKLDAIACLEFREGSGCTVKHIATNPLYLGVETNAEDWLLKGIEVIVQKRLNVKFVRAPSKVVSKAITESMTNKVEQKQDKKS